MVKRFAVLTRFGVEHYNVAALVVRGTVTLSLALATGTSLLASGGLGAKNRPEGGKDIDDSELFVAATAMKLRKTGPF